MGVLYILGGSDMGKNNEVTSILGKTSPPQIKGNTPPINRKNSLKDDNSEEFRKTPVDKKHLKNPARDFDDDGHLTPLDQYPMKDFFDQESDRNMFDFSPYDDEFPIDRELQTPMDDYLAHLVSEIERTENERKKVREEERRLEERIDRLNKMVRDKLYRKKSKGRKKYQGTKKGNGAGSSKLHEIINQLKF